MLDKSAIWSKRRAGILLHPTSLPDGLSTGCLGHARRWIDFIASAGFSVWQTLPLSPVDDLGSPYQSCSAFAGEVSIIDVQQLYRWGLLTSAPDGSVCTQQLLQEAATRFPVSASADLKAEYEKFILDSSLWLHDYALFKVIHKQFACPWYQWPEPLRFRTPDALSRYVCEHSDQILQQQVLQFFFCHQWRELKQYANAKGIIIFGDMPIFVAHDSVDVWCRSGQFCLDQRGQMTRIAAVPPDCFAATGQLWNMPHYNWPQMSADHYSWWRERLASQLKLFDLIRIDHFRGFESAYGVSSKATDATQGQWYPGPGIDFFQSMERQLGWLPLVAEDLGFITKEVNQLRQALGIPGMRVLQFAFDNNGQNPHLPHNHEENMVVYTGTHDNNTTLGWWQAAEPELQRRVQEYYCGECTPMPDTLIHSVLASVAKMAIIPFQDLLKLGADARMNVPGSVENNWRWKLSAQDLNQNLSDSYRVLLERFGRL